MPETVTEDDLDFVQRSLKIVSLWIAVFALASVAMIVYGDVLMQLFT